ncbi:MAG: hypothetical protein KAR20_02950 [Candidatus Heimdallarchaeota archaeon]|nr:hypothetical protein [Candidatus Heimdallarchaeota archaeon]
MPMKPKEIKKEVEEEVIGARVKIVQRDLALTWPSSDANAENPMVFEDYITVLMNGGWKIENSQIGQRRAIGDMKNEFVIPILFVMTR